jgi:hypothetical protein
MSKVFSVHVLEPLPGANQEAFEKLMLDLAALPPSSEAEGWQSYVTKGDRGDRKGQYCVIHEFDSVEVRDSYFPVEGGEPSELAQRILTSGPPELFERWGALVRPLGAEGYTDYVTM